MAKKKARIPKSAAKKFAAQPVTAGSDVTQGDLARMRDQAVQVRYGTQRQGVEQEVASGQQLGRDQEGWYGNFLKELDQHRNNVAGITAAANQSNQQLLGSIQTNDQATRQKLQGEATASAAARGATDSGQNTLDAVGASSARQAMLAAFAGELGAKGRSATTYADTVAHVVGPGQRLQAQAQNQRTTQAAKEKLTRLGELEGQYGQQFADEIIASEQKNVLARQALALDQDQFTVSAADTAADNARADTALTQQGDLAAQKKRDAAAKQRENDAEANKKHVEGVREKSSTAIGRLADIGQRYTRYASTPYRDKEGKEVIGQPKRAAIRDRLLKEGFTEAEVNLALAWRRAEREYGYLTPTDIQTAHSLGIKVPVKLRRPRAKGPVQTQTRPN